MRRALIVAALTLTLLTASGLATVRPSAADEPAIAGRPNIVLFLTDDQTVDSFRRMTNVMNQPDTVTFSNAWINNALCCPSRATILTGQYDTNTGVTNNTEARHLNDRETIAVWLRRAGYRTGLFGKYLNGVTDKRAVPPGWSDFQSVWPDAELYRQYGYRLVDNGRVIQYGHGTADYEVDVLARRASRFIAQAATAGDPFLLYFAPTATHGPFVAGPGEKDMFAATNLPPVAAFNEDDVSDKPAFIRALPKLDPVNTTYKRRKQWAASVSVDKAFASIEAQLKASGVAGNTVVIAMTDNGYGFGAHRWEVKMCQYRACSETPLLIRYPGVTPRTVARYVSNVDIASTIADLANVTPGVRQDGRSLVPLILDQPVSGWPTGVLHHWGGGDSFGGTGDHGPVIPPFYAIRAEMDGSDWTYVELATGERELYDLARDPDELENVAGRAAYGDAQSRLADRLDAMKAAAR